MQSMFFRSDWIGIAIGIVLGLIQPFVVVSVEFGSILQIDSLMSVALFGLVAPPLLAVVNKLFKTGTSQVQQMIGQHINTVFMLIAFGVTTGIIGLIYHYTIGLPTQSIVPIVFFGSAGVGFIIAYLIYPDLANRPKNT